MIYYKKFTENNIFENALTNIVFNQFFTYLVNVFQEDLITTRLLLTGNVARLMQSLYFKGSISVVEFITSDRDIFNLIAVGYSNLNVTQAIVQDNIILLRINDIDISVKLSSVDLESTNIEGIYVQTLT